MRKLCLLVIPAAILGTQQTPPTPPLGLPPVPWPAGNPKRHGVPASRTFSDKTLHALAASRPESAAQLLAIPGIGIGIVEKYGAELYRLLHERA